MATRVPEIFGLVFRVKKKSAGSRWLFVWCPKSRFERTLGGAERPNALKPKYIKK